MRWRSLTAVPVLALAKQDAVTLWRSWTHAWSGDDRFAAVHRRLLVVTLSLLVVSAASGVANVCSLRLRPSYTTI
jgi:hypothetical protein